MGDKNISQLKLCHNYLLPNESSVYTIDDSIIGAGRNGTNDIYDLAFCSFYLKFNKSIFEYGSQGLSWETEKVYVSPTLTLVGNAIFNYLDPWGGDHSEDAAFYSDIVNKFIVVSKDALLSRADQVRSVVNHCKEKVAAHPPDHYMSIHVKMHNELLTDTENITLKALEGKSDVPWNGCGGTDIYGEPLIREGIEKSVKLDGIPFHQGGGFLSIKEFNQCEAEFLCCMQNGKTADECKTLTSKEKQRLKVRLAKGNELKINERAREDELLDTQAERHIGSFWAADAFPGDDSFGYMFGNTDGSLSESYRAARYSRVSARCVGSPVN